MERVEQYFILLKDLGFKEKLTLIAMLADSLLRDDKAQREKEFLSLAGKLETEESAEELIEEIEKARHFDREDVQF